MGFYAFRGFGDVGSESARIVGDISFSDPAAKNNWLGWLNAGHPVTEWQRRWEGEISLGGAPWIDMRALYTPPSLETVQRADEVWGRLQGAVDLGTPSAGKARARMDQLRLALTPWIEKVNLTSTKDYPTLLMAYNMISTLVRGLANESWPDPVAELEAAQAQSDAAAAAKVAADAEAQARREQTQVAIAAAEEAARRAEAAAAKAKRTSRSAMTSSGGVSTPVLAALIGVPVLLAAVFALKGRRSSVSGYRRRRRR